ncbi:hypothetical protein VTK56DRAFT_6014 [Thermocarpiscus australiensis]
MSRIRPFVTSIGSNTVTTVPGKRKIILSTSALHTPRILQLGSIGQRDVVEPAAIDVKKTSRATRLVLLCSLNGDSKPSAICTAGYLI